MVKYELDLKTIKNKNMSVHVTGASGFLGRNVIENLCQLIPQQNIIGSDVVDFSQNHFFTQDVVGKFSFNKVSFLDKDYDKYLKEGDSFIHLARTIRPGPSGIDYNKDIQENVLGTINLFQRAIDKGIKKFIFISSGGTVYGQDNPAERFKESHTCNPLSLYGLSMLTIENYLKILAKSSSDVKLVILRLSNLYGPYQQPNRGQGLINTVIENVYNNKPVEIWGTGKSVRDYLFTKDVATSIFNALNYSGPSTTFNIGSGIGRTTIEVIEDIQKVIKYPIELKHIQGSSIHVNRNVLDIDLAKADLGWKPKTDWFAGLEHTIDYYEKTKQLVKV